MNIILSMPGKLLCNIGYHYLTTKVLPHKKVENCFVVMRCCTRCGFQYFTGRYV